MKKSELKTMIKEESENWTGKDLIDTAKALVLSKKSLLGAIQKVFGEIRSKNDPK